MQNINVNIVPDSYPQTIRYSQGDVGREFKINVVGFTIPTGATVKIQATKPSGFGFSVAGTVDDNAVSFTTTAIMTDEAGRFPAELEITKDSVVIGTANFIMWGEANPHPEGTTDGQQGTIIPELTLLVERVEAAASSVLDMEVVAKTLPAGSQATYSYDENLNKATFGIPQGEAGAGAAGVVADAYSSSKTYKVGDYVLHNNNLYRCTTAITTAEAFTAAHWTQIVLANDVSDLKTDLDEYADIFTGDVDESVKNWLDEHPEATTTVEDGSITFEKLADNVNKNIRRFDNVVEMQQATNLTNGMVVYTNGFNTIGDGGNSCYLISNNVVANGMDIIALNNGLFATLIIENDTINIAQIGCGANTNIDCQPYIMRALALAKNVLIGDGEYTIEQSIVVPTDKNIMGVTPINNYGYGTIIKTVGFNISAFVINTTNVLIKNINIVHSYNQTASIPVIDFSESRYVRMENVIITKDDNSKTSSCVALYCQQSSPSWSGYITLVNVRASNYKHSLYVKSTLLTCYNCVFNTDSEENVKLAGEVFAFIGCDISGSGLAFTYDGECGCKFIGCYFEGFYAPFYTSKGGKIDFESCKYNLIKPVAGTETVFGNETNLNAFVLPNYINGFHSTSNMCLNGSFNKALTKWTTVGTGISVVDCSLDGFKKAVEFTLDGSGKRLYQNIPLEKGIYTFSMWIKFDYGVNTSGYVDLYAMETGTSKDGIRIVQRLATATGLPSGEWVKIIGVFNVPEANTYNAVVFYIAANNATMQITGITMHRGKYVEDDYLGNSCNEKNVLTDELIIKGTDNNYYKIKVVNGALTAESL